MVARVASSATPGRHPGKNSLTIRQPEFYVAARGCWRERDDDRQIHSLFKAIGRCGGGPCARQRCRGRRSRCSLRSTHPLGPPMNAALNLLNRVEDAISSGSLGRRSEMLRHVTDLFVLGAPQCSDDDVALFDTVFARLATEIERSARALLAVRLAPIPNAPPNTIRALAFDDAIEVAGPVLTQSERLDETALVENASTKGQGHLLAISRRRVLSEAVTDALVEFGDRQVVLSTAENPGARFSEAGFAKLVKRSDGDDPLALCV